MTGIRGAAKKSLDKKLYEEARNDLFDIQRLLNRIAITDEQQEEYDIFIQKSEEIDTKLRHLAKQGKKAKMTDEVARVLYYFKNVTKNEFLSGSRIDVSKLKKHIGEIKKLHV